MNGMSTYTLNVPTDKVRLFKSLTKELDGTMAKPKTDRFRGNVVEHIPTINGSRAFFKDCVSHWYMETLFCSSVSEIVNNKYFKAIVDMGTVAAPFIVEEISKKPSPLVWALNAIYETRISDDPQTTISQACDLWIKRLKWIVASSKLRNETHA